MMNQGSIEVMARNKLIDKSYIEREYRLAFLDFKTAKNEDEQWNARRSMAKLEQIAMQEFGFEYADKLQELRGDVNGSH